MSFPLWDPIDIPPDYTAVDVNSIEDEDLRMELQGLAVDYWMEIEGASPDPREWSDDEGMFALYDTEGEVIGVMIILDVEDA